MAEGVAQLGPEFIPYQPETLMNYELGLKGAWLGGDLAADSGDPLVETGVLTVARAYLQPSSTLAVQLNGATPGSQYDVLQVAGEAVTTLARLGDARRAVRKRLEQLAGSDERAIRERARAALRTLAR